MRCTAATVSIVILMLASFGRAHAQAPDLLVILLDDVSPEEINTNVRGRYPNAFPNIDSLEASGTRFDRFYAGRWCKPTRRMLLMSKWAGNIIGLVCTNSPKYLNRNAPMMPKTFGAAGYQTALFGKWHLGGNTLCPWECTPQLFGFHTIRAGVPEDTTACLPGRAGNYEDWLRWDDSATRVETEYQTLALLDEFEAWELETRGRGPRFAWVSFQTAHSPYHIPPSELLPPGLAVPPDPTERQKYELMVLSLDVAIGRVLDAFVTPPWVVVLSDNGTPGDVSEPFQRSNRVKNSNYEGGVRVYCTIAGPGLPARVDDTVLSVVDIFPTVVQAVGLDVPVGLEGQNFTPLLFGQPAARRGYASACPDNTNPWRRPYAVEKRWKIHRDRITPYPWGIDALFDLETDPEENFPMDPSVGPQGPVSLLQAVLDGRGTP